MKRAKLHLSLVAAAVTVACAGSFLCQWASSTFAGPARAGKASVWADRKQKLVQTWNPQDNSALPLHEASAFAGVALGVSVVVSMMVLAGVRQPTFSLRSGRSGTRLAAITQREVGTEQHVSFWDSLMAPMGLVKVPAPAGEKYFGPRPVGVQHLGLSQELLSFLAEEEVCACGEDGLKSAGFERCVDHPELPGHIYYEGCFHTLPTSEAVNSVHPRYGHDFQKPAAPLRFRAFAESCRRINSATLQAMADAMPHGTVLRTALEDGRAFADLAVQVHCGDAVGPEEVAWHFDAPNSSLHMAVSLRGERTLKMKVRKPDAYAPEVVEEPQHAGDIYVGNPMAFEHGLEYPAASWGQRMVACQFRLLMCEAELRDPRVVSGSRELAQALVEKALRIPSLEEVQEAAEELMKQEITS